MATPNATLSELDYPLSVETTHEYANKIFSAISRGESISCIWVPLMGRRTFTNFIIQNLEIFKKELPDYEKKIFALVEPLDLTEEGMEGYMRLMGKELLNACDRLSDKRINELKVQADLFDDETLSYSRLLTNLKKLISNLVELGYSVSFLWGEFDDIDSVSFVFFNNLKSLWNQFFPNVQYVFLMKKDVSKRDKVYIWGDLNQLILQNVQYVPILNAKDTKHVIKRITDQLDISPNREDIENIVSFCGGHPYMLYIGFKEWREMQTSEGKGSLTENLLDHYAIESVIRAISDVWEDHEISLLKKIALSEELSGQEEKRLDVFLKLGIVQLIDGRYKLFSRAYKEGVLNTLSKNIRVSSELSVDPITSQILFMGKSIEDKFTQQEYSVLSLLLKNSEVVVTRDALADILWGEDSADKYSDWAIDQLMSKIRKKLKKIDAKSKIATIRSRGYKYST